jgi:hypothetical protein
MAAAAIGAFLKSIVPGLKGLTAIGRGGISNASNAFRAARGAGIGSRITTAATAGRTSIAGSWTAAGRIPGAQQSMRNAGIALGTGAGLLAINRAGAETRGA